MRNLYAEGKNIRDVVQSNDKALAFFKLYFINGILKSVGERYVKDIDFADTLKVDSIKDIHINDQIKLYQIGSSFNGLPFHLDNSNGYLKKHSITMPEEYYNDFISKIKNELSNLGRLEDDTFILDCSLQDLIIACMFYTTYSISDNSFSFDGIREVVKNNDEFAEEVHSNLFEKYFLDELLADELFKSMKDNITIDNPDKSYEEMYFHRSFLIFRESEVAKNPSSYREKYGYVISDRYYDLFLDVVKNFMQRYDLGGVNYLYTASSIEFNTNVGVALDAYYMEKQRIEHLVNSPKTLTEKDKHYLEKRV